VHAQGGWDPLCAFAPLFDAPDIDMEASAQPARIHGLDLVDHPDRPAVRAFFETYGDQTVVLNGVSVRSVNHETCQAVALTGATSDARTDWATRVADAYQGAHRIPHRVLDGPVFPGDRAVLVSRAQGRLQSLVRGDVFAELDVPVAEPHPTTTPVVDRYLRRRAAARLGVSPGSVGRIGYAEAIDRAQGLVSDRLELALVAAPELSGQVDTAASALASGLSRCVTLSTPFQFDTHADNSQQTPVLNGLFESLSKLVTRLGARPGPTGALLSDDTVVVVVSEMGRTPAYNATRGRDHWPYTSTLLIGPGLTCGRIVGGYTASYAGIGVDPSTGMPDPRRPGIPATTVGATLLALAGLDVGEWLPGTEPLRGILT
jgi:hypothetical protein